MRKVHDETTRSSKYGAIFGGCACAHRQPLPQSRKAVGVAMGISLVSEAFGSKPRHLWAPKKPDALHHSFVLHVVEVATPSSHALVHVCVSLL